ncbi:hypothetical protein LOTGIDRAFT_162969 [Lottia gigantea]|uniref:Uncharacterized protein n=1 Tax=Lottia gigantea TaxID=225164 RepID=V4AA72_LOTGI|nr:hypothetical protein LOTGIDRAFT_162969 [Lottia gigantea]ESO91965.1 hypothetical protein LOTGIDRAFT_162969 [Lottia gigantea]
MPKMYVLVFLCLTLGVVSRAEKESAKKVPEFGKPDQEVVSTSKPNLTDIEVIMERQRQLETIRMAGYLTLKALEDTKVRSEELTAILDERVQTIRKLLKRLPFIVGYLVNRNQLGVHLELPIMSRVFLMTSMGTTETIDSNLPTKFESYFKKMNASRSAAEVMNLKEFALKEMETLTRKIGNNYLGRTINHVDSSVTFMQSGLNQTRDMVIKLPDLLLDVMTGPYDTVSEDRILEEYHKYIKNSE